MAAKSISNDRCRSSASAYNSEFEEPSSWPSVFQFWTEPFKLQAPLRVSKTALPEEMPVVSTPVSIEFQYNDQAEVISQTSCVYPRVGGRLVKV